MSPLRKLPSEFYNVARTNMIAHKMNFVAASVTWTWMGTKSWKFFAPDPWPLEPKINRLRQTVEDNIVPSFKSVWCLVFVLSHAHPHTHTPAYTPWQAERSCKLPNLTESDRIWPRIDRMVTQPTRPRPTRNGSARIESHQLMKNKKTRPQ